MLCRDLFPKATIIDDFIIYHDPDGGDNPIERNKRYENTLILMEKYFHEKPNSLVWEPAQSAVSSKRPRDDKGDDKTTDEELDEIITICVRDDRDEVSDKDVFFKLKKSTRMGIIKSVYAESRGVSIDAFTFMFDGSRIHDMCTPMSLEMEDNDVINSTFTIEGC